MIYVDDMEAPCGRMKMCHMIADSHDELIAMVKLIGVSSRWAQALGTYREHFDVCKAKRALAVAHGAQEISQKELSRILLKKREILLAARPTPEEGQTK